MPRVYKRNGRHLTCATCGGSFYRPQCFAKARYCSVRCMRIAQAGSADPAEAFWLKVDKSAGQEGCWPYQGFRKWDGYGWLSRQGKYMTAHRYAWILTNGQVPDGLHLLHTCDNPPCCNPAHLRLGTHRDNMADRVAKGRHRMGRIYKDRVRPSRKAA